MGSKLLQASSPTLAPFQGSPGLPTGVVYKEPEPQEPPLVGPEKLGAEAAHLHLVAAASGFGRVVLKGQAFENSYKGRPCGQAGLGRRGWALWAGRGQEQIWKGRRQESLKRLRLVLINSPLHQCLQF